MQRKELPSRFICRNVFIGLTLSHHMSREILLKERTYNRGLSREENRTICLHSNVIRIGEEHTTKDPKRKMWQKPVKTNEQAEAGAQAPGRGRIVQSQEPRDEASGLACCSRLSDWRARAKNWRGKNEGWLNRPSKCFRAVSEQRRRNESEKSRENTPASACYAGLGWLAEGKLLAPMSPDFPPRFPCVGINSLPTIWTPGTG